MKPGFETSVHPDDEQLAAWADGRLDPRLAQACRAHVARCGRCLSAYEEIVAARAAAADDRLPAAPAAVMRSGAAIARRRQGHARAATLALVPVAVLAVLFLLRADSRRADGDLGVPPVVVEAVREYSSNGLLMPGVGEIPPGRAAPVYRSNGLAATEAVLAAVREIDGRYELQPSEPLAYWRAAGLLAAGQRGAVRTTLAESLRRFPGSVSLRIVEAALAYQESDLRGARRILESAAERDPGNELVRLNLRRLTEMESGAPEAVPAGE